MSEGSRPFATIVCREYIVRQMVADIVRAVFRYIHIIGMASVVGGLLVQIGKENRRVGSLEFHGLIGQLITGIILVGITINNVDHIKVTVKLVILILLFVLFIVQRRAGKLSKRAYMIDLLLALAITGVAVFWRVYGA